VAQALRRPDRLQWVKAIESEWRSLCKLGTFEQVDLPKRRRPIGVKWVLKIKRLPDGRLDKYKARLVVKGYRQVHGLDYDLLFAPVAKKTSLLYFLHFVAAEDLECHSIDYNTAFLNGELEEEIYIEQPELYDDKSGQALKLKKALYGLKQAPRQWYKALSGKLQAAGFTFCAVDAAVARIVYRGRTAWILIYVDDVLVAARELGIVRAVKKLLLNIYEGTDKGELQDFLGMAVHRDRSTRRLYLDQSAYASKILRDAGLTEMKSKRIPLQPNQHKDPPGDALSAYATESYRRTVGELMYLANSTRPDLAYAAAYLACHLQVPTRAHQAHLKHTLGYLSTTTSYVLTLGRQTEDAICGYVDSDWASEPHRRSVFGFCFQVQGSTVAWRSKRLRTVARSSMEAEFMAAGEAVREAIRLQWLRYFLHGASGAIKMYSDSRTAVGLIKNPTVEDMRKHIDVIYNHVREREDAGYVDFEWIEGSTNTADTFTKALPHPAFVKHRDGLRLSVATH